MMPVLTLVTWSSFREEQSAGPKLQPTPDYLLVEPGVVVYVGLDQLSQRVVNSEAGGT